MFGTFCSNYSSSVVSTYFLRISMWMFSHTSYDPKVKSLLWKENRAVWFIFTNWPEFAGWRSKFDLWRVHSIIFSAPTHSVTGSSAVARGMLIYQLSQSKKTHPTCQQVQFCSVASCGRWRMRTKCSPAGSHRSPLSSWPSVCYDILERGTFL